MQNTSEIKKKSLDSVEKFWEENLCGAHYIDSDISEYTLDFFEKYRDFRYKKEHHLDTLIDWTSSKGKTVLEVGLGLGADAQRWAQYAKSLHGIDLTIKAVNATKAHLKLMSLEGVIIQGNVEELPYEDETFDLVYSQGVLHHTHNTASALQEIHRVLKVDGQGVFMFYTKNSLNYWLRIQLIMRIKFLWAMLTQKIGYKPKGIWLQHMANFDKFSWKYFSWSAWPHSCTDGPNCEVAYIRSKNELIQMLTLSGFKIDKTVKTHFPIGAGATIEAWLAKWIGFYQFFWVTKND